MAARSLARSLAWPAERLLSEWTGRANTWPSVCTRARSRSLHCQPSGRPHAFALCFLPFCLSSGPSRLPGIDGVQISTQTHRLTASQARGRGSAQINGLRGADLQPLEWPLSPLLRVAGVRPPLCANVVSRPKGRAMKSASLRGADDELTRRKSTARPLARRPSGALIMLIVFALAKLARRAHTTGWLAAGRPAGRSDDRVSEFHLHNRRRAGPAATNRDF